MVDIDISHSALDDLESLPSDVQDRIKSKLLGDVSDDPSRHLRPLESSEYYSIRVGEYRVIVDHVPDNSRIKVFAVGHRKKIYDRYFD